MKSFGRLTGSGLMILVALLVCGNSMGQTDGKSDKVPDTIKFSTTAGDVEFPHLTHIEDLEIDCIECHHGINASELKMPHDDYFTDFWIDCKICHLPGGAPKTAEKCSTCHKRNPTSVSDETLSAKVAIHQTCWQCHEVTKGPEASAACDECHVRNGE